MAYYLGRDVTVYLTTESDEAQVDVSGNAVSAISAGGSATSPSGNLSSTEYYDGTCWSGRTNLLENCNTTSGGGSSNAGFTAGGYNTGALSATEEWTAPLVQFVAV